MAQYITRDDGQSEPVWDKADGPAMTSGQLTNYADEPGYAIRLPDRADG